MTPRMVVLTGAYNEQDYLEETIPSILSQSFRDYLLILTDNGSTDQTAGMLQDFAASDDRVVFNQFPTNLWGPVAMNRGMALALTLAPETHWFLAHGADDVMLPEYLQRVMDTADANPSCNCIYSPWEYMGGVRPAKRFPSFNPETCHEQHQMPAWRAITRELWEQVGPENETIRIGADWEWPVRARHLLKPVQLDRPYLSLRVRPPGRLSQSEEVNWRELYRTLCRVADKPIAGWAV